MISPSPATPPGPDPRRHNRRWMVVLMLSPVVVIIVVLLAVLTDGPPEPSVKPVSIPAGYRAITDAYFGYSIPAPWKENNAYTDSNGDYFYQGRSGWVAENVRIRDKAPVPGTDAPAQLATFGQRESVPYVLGPAQPVTVPGITDAYDYSMSRTDGFRATALEVWEGPSQTEMWMLVKADPATTTTILASLAGFQVPKTKR